MIDDVKRVLIQAHLDGDRCLELEHELLRQKMGDLQQIHATLVLIGKDYAEWVLEDGRRIVSRGHGTFGQENAYEVFEAFGNVGMFRKWLWSARTALVENQKDPDNVSMPGLISVSYDMKLIVGWQEDYSDEEAQLLALAETMNE